ncbi:SusC/RagA family TonB-linked outer membrane protein [Confluentibacter flavum]|uniref:SusC/RagA family TonB-linked outer membrane protein n=1 Tax=Confluentibacter flavum TaxID=1909700 RepID=A0A2N3HHJ0_9FLAO|nr:SusC/RagA family TonB-linked outer membrane protein [Confluentibacter flavum]PKQ44429.1 SusC/RagA family TonB-linked outer membrane protein [Confluentibacter flavum]
MKSKLQLQRFKMCSYYLSLKRVVALFFVGTSLAFGNSISLTDKMETGKNDGLSIIFSGNNNLLKINIGVLAEGLQQRTVTGIVTNEMGEPLLGASILVKGTNNGVVTDFDGNFNIDISANDSVLIISYLGYATQELEIGSRTVFNVQMQSNAAGLGEVVVTALGVKRQKKSLTYSTQNVDLDGIDEVRPVQNLVNSLSGKIAGLSMVRTGSGVSGRSRVNLRGNRSISGSSEPLYVLDGVPLAGDISDISPDDIASISVLKGGNAAALYGSRANNGAIVLTTKSGTGNRLKIDFNITTTLETGKMLFDYQNEYGQGVGGSYYNNGGFPLTSSLESWGQRLDGFDTPHWSADPSKQGITIPYSANPNRFRDFMQTGSTQAYNVTASGGNEKSQTYFGYTYEVRKGIFPGNELKRHNITVKNNQKFINDKLVLDSKINFIRTDLYNQVGVGSWGQVYNLASNFRIQDVRDFEYYDVNGKLRQSSWAPGASLGNNPYWLANRNPSNTADNRILSYASLTYNFNDNLKIMARSAFENSESFFETRQFNDTYIIAVNGNYGTQSLSSYDWNSDFLVSYDNKINDNFKYSLNFGGNNRQLNGRSLTTFSNGLSVPNLFALANTLNPRTEEGINRKEVQSLYGFGNIGYKDALFLDLTYRNDWSSTLPEANRSYGYFSAGLSAVVSDFFKFGDGFSYLKLRGSYAEVGNDTGAFNLDRAAQLRIGELIFITTTEPNSNLKSESTISTELGFDARFFNNRWGLDFTYYKTNSRDQIFAQDVPLGSGARSRFINGADIENRGFEVILTGNPIRTTDFDWNFTANFSKNDSEVLALADGIDVLSIGNTNFGIRNMQLSVGSQFGDFYSRGFLRDSQNRIIVGSDGLPLVTDGKSVLVANFNPDWLGGIRNTFRYKNINLSFLIDIRQGGTVISQTLANLASNGLLERTVNGRDGTLVVGSNVLGSNGAVKEDGSPNDIQVSSEALWKMLGNSEQPIGEPFVEDASNVRLREFSLGYSFPSKFLKGTGFERAQIGLVGSNLFFFSRNSSFDPEVTTGTATNQEGFEFNAPPLTRSLGLNIKVGF